MNELWSYRIGVPLSRILPRKLAYWIAEIIAGQCYRRDHVGRNALLANLTQIFESQGRVPGTDTLEGFVLKTYQYFAKNLVDFFRYSTITKREIKRLVTLEKLEYVRACYEEGRGVILLTAHFGNWELGGAVLAGLGYPINAVVLPQRLAKLNRLFQQQRRRHGMQVIELGHSPRKLMRCLQRGELLALLGDRDFSPVSHPCRFFGRPAMLPRGPAWLAVKTGAPIVPVFVLREVDDTFLMKFCEPIRPDGVKSMEAVQDRICRVLENEIVNHPNQWFIFERFWKDQPPPAKPRMHTNEHE